MNVFFRNCSASALLVVFAAGETAAQQTQTEAEKKLQLNTITTAVPFLLIGPDSRAGGLGDGGCASSPDANSIHWNASKLAFAEKKMGLSISYIPWLRALVPDINLAYLSGYYKAKKDQAFAGSLRYFSLGDITFTDQTGNTIGQFRPNEFAIDFAYSRKLAERFSAAMATRYIFSNLTSGINVAGTATKPGQAFAVDISTYYQNKEMKLGDKKGTLAIGANISNIGNKMAYSNSGEKDFIPINMRIGGALTMELDQYNTFAFVSDISKLLVPTPPVYKLDANGNPVIDPGTGKPEIEDGKDPDRGVAAGIFGSFSDAPNGFNEELKEINPSIGMEYWYDRLFAFRVGYFHEDKTKGAREYFTVGAGLRYNVFALDMAYLIPTKVKNPLANTLRFTLMFDFDAFKKQSEGGDSKSE